MGIHAVVRILLLATRNESAHGKERIAAALCASRIGARAFDACWFAPVLMGRYERVSSRVTFS